MINYNIASIVIRWAAMSFYDEVEIEDMKLINGIYYYPCPCGDYFSITCEQIEDGEEIAKCPSCPLYIKIIS